MVITLIQLCGAFLLMRWFDARLAWVLLVLTPLAIVFGKLIVRRLRQMTLDIRQDESQIQMQVQEGMEHNAVLRSLGAELWVTDRLDTMQQRLRGNVMRRTRFTVIARIIMGAPASLSSPASSWAVPSDSAICWPSYGEASACAMAPSPSVS